MLTLVLDDLHVAEIGALAELGGTYLEVHGKVVDFITHY